MTLAELIKGQAMNARALEKLPTSHYGLHPGGR